MTDTDDYSTSAAENTNSVHGDSCSAPECDDSDPIGSSMEDIQTFNDNIKKAMLILDNQNEFNMDNIETILQRAKLANIPSQYLREIYRYCLIQSRKTPSVDSDMNKESHNTEQSNNIQIVDGQSSNSSAEFREVVVHSCITHGQDDHNR